MPCNVLAPAPTAASQRMKQHDTVLTDVECYGLKAANMKSMPCQLETDKFESQSLGVVLENHDEYRNETKDDGQVQYESLQTHEAELRRLEEEKALYQGSVQIKQKIRVCRQQIFSAMQRLQVSYQFDCQEWACIYQNTRKISAASLYNYVISDCSH